MKKLYEITGAFASWFALILQLYISLHYADSRLTALIKYLSFMTIWTNFLVAFTFTCQLIPSAGRLIRFFKEPAVLGGVLLYIIVVALVYHLVLANIWNPKGLEKIADEFLHSVVPLLYIFYWLLYVKKGNLSFIYCFKWLIYPLIYLVYSMIRGALTGVYPYFFLDASRLGFAVTFRNIAFVTTGYILLGIIIIYADRLLSPKKSDEAH